MQLGIETPKKDRTSDVTAFYEKAFWTGIKDTDRNVWLAARRKLVTASEVPALLGLSPREDALDIYVSKLVEPTQDVYHGLNDRRTWGKALESGVAFEVRRAMNWDRILMSGALLVSRDLPILGCTQDAEVLEREGTPWASYEGKTVEVYRADGWDEESGRMPDYVIAQVQSQQFVTHAPKTHVTCLVGLSRLVRIEMFPEPDFFVLIREAVEDMARRLEKLDPPPATWRSRKALKAMYPEESGETIVLPKEAVEWSRELDEIAPKLKQLEQRKDELRNLLAQAIGNATVGVLPTPLENIAQWSYSTVNKREHVVAATSFRQLRSSKPKKVKK